MYRLEGGWVLLWMKENATKDVMRATDESDHGWQIREKVNLCGQYCMVVTEKNIPPLRK